MGSITNNKANIHKMCRYHPPLFQPQAIGTDIISVIKPISITRASLLVCQGVVAPITEQGSKSTLDGLYIHNQAAASLEWDLNSGF